MRNTPLSRIELYAQLLKLKPRFDTFRASNEVHLKPEDVQLMKDTYPSIQAISSGAMPISLQTGCPSCMREAFYIFLHQFDKLAKDPHVTGDVKTGDELHQAAQPIVLDTLLSEAGREKAALYNVDGILETVKEYTLEDKNSAITALSGFFNGTLEPSQLESYGKAFESDLITPVEPVIITADAEETKTPPAVTGDHIVGAAINTPQTHTAKQKEANKEEAKKAPVKVAAPKAPVKKATPKAEPTKPAKKPVQGAANKK